MKNSPIAPTPGNIRVARSLSQRALSALLAGFISVSLPVTVSRAQPSSYEAEGEEVLTRGPVHEAFAAVVSYNPTPGMVVKTRPPELIEELPPEERPEGDDVAWIPGYWGWDDERNDFLWISGTWRVVPPGREWMAGYWRENNDGYQWISGYWADATQQETTYLPPPPATLEIGANSDAPSDDYGWTPGCWVWQQDRYAWRAGYWAQGRADWVWSPSYYVWTPRGVIFVEGFWDYPVEQRGILFAPVYYQSRGYSRRGYSYSPRIAINLELFQDNLFLRPSYHHYYFGDYYGSRYEQEGFYASVSFQSNRQGFEPFYAHDRWQHRSDRDWDHRFRASYQDRRDHEAARPPRTWSAQLTINTRPAVGGQVRLQLAVPLAQLARRPDNPVHFQAVARDDRQKLAQRGREVQQSRDQRQTLEAKGVIAGSRSAGAVVEPARVAAPRSPIVARPDGQRGRNQAPPARPQAPRPDPQAQPRAEAPARQSNGDRRAIGSEERKAQPAPEPRPSASSRVQGESLRKEQEAQARSDDQQRNREATAKSQQEQSSRQQAAEERAKGAADVRMREDSSRQAQQDSDRRNRDAADKTRRQDENNAKESATKARDEAQQQAQESQRKAEESSRQTQQDANRRSRDAEEKSQAAEKSKQQDEERARDAVKVREELQRKEPPVQARSPQDGERANAAAKAREEAPRREQPAPARAQPDDGRRGRDAAVREQPAQKDKPAKDDDDDARKDKEKSR